MRRPPDVNPAEFDAAMRPEAGDPWEPVPYDTGWWVMSRQFGWLGPFSSSRGAVTRAEQSGYVDDWQIVMIETLTAPPDGSPF